MNALLRLVMFPNVLALLAAHTVARLTMSLPATVAALAAGYVVGLLLGRWIWPPTRKRPPA